MALKIRSTSAPFAAGEIQPGWSIEENTTAHALGASSSSVGGVGFSVANGDNPEFLMNKAVTVYYEDDNKVGETGNNVSGHFDSVAAGTLGTSLTSTNPIGGLSINTNVSPIFNKTNIVFDKKDGNAIGINALGFYPRVNPITGLVNTICSRAPGYGLNQYDFYGNVSPYISQFSGGPSLNNSDKFDFDSLGNIYVLSTGSNVVAKYNASGVFLTSWSSSGLAFQNLVSIKFNPADGYIWTVDRISRVQAYTTAGSFVRTWQTYDNFFTPSSGIGVRCLDIAFSNGLVHAALGSGIFALNPLDGSQVFYTNYSTTGYLNANGPKNIDIDRFGNYVVNNYGRLSVIGQRSSTIIDTDFISATQTSIGIEATAGKGAVVTQEGNYFVVADTNFDGTKTNYEVKSFSGSASSLRAYFYALTNGYSGFTGFDYSGSNPTIAFTGWSDNLWAKINELCSAYSKELVVVNNRVVVRDVGSNAIQVDNILPNPVNNIGANKSGRHIEVVAQNSRVVNNEVVFDYSFDQSRSISAAAGEYNTTNIKTSAWLTSVQNPTPALGALARYPSAGNYFISTQDGTFVPPDVWAKYGGSLQASLGADGFSIDVTVIGPPIDIPSYKGPYSISSKVGSGNSTGISIIGSGIGVNPQTLKIATGADWSSTVEDVAQTINNPFVTSAGIAYDRVPWASTMSNGLSQEIEVAIPLSQVGGLGLVCGSIFTLKKCQWRVTGSTVSNSVVTLRASRYTTVGSHDALYASQTIGTHDAKWGGLTLGDTTVKPLY